MRLAHLSDPHFGAEDATIAAAVATTLRRLRVDAVVVTGDFTMSALPAEFEAAREWLDGLPRPLLFIPGNHDIPKFNPLHERFLHPFRRYQDRLGGDLQPVLALPEGRVVGLNSSRPCGWSFDWSRGRLSPAQLASLPDAFAGMPATWPRIVALHHPTIAQAENRRALVAPLPAIRRALAAERVDVVLGGHFHQSYLMELPGMQSGAWQTVASQVSTVCSVRLQGEPQGFHILEFSPDELAGERHAWDGGSFVQLDTLRFRRHGTHGWSRLIAA
jgi:3',5'-cyclic AMP phosphodiesterase CpdA